MIDLIAWRLSFEALEMMSVVGFKFGRCRNFAYGADLDPQVLTDRRIHVFSKIPYELPEHHLVFNNEGPYLDSGFASVEPAPGHSVFGAVYEISKLDALRMDYYERVSFLRSYRRVKPSQDPALFYYRSARPKSDLLPTFEYQQKILLGLRLLAAPQIYIDQIAQSPLLKAPLRLKKSLHDRIQFWLSDKPGLIRALLPK